MLAMTHMSAVIQVTIKSIARRSPAYTTFISDAYSTQHLISCHIHVVELSASPMNQLNFANKSLKTKSSCCNKSRPRLKYSHEKHKTGIEAYQVSQ